MPISRGATFFLLALAACAAPDDDGAGRAPASSASVDSTTSSPADSAPDPAASTPPDSATATAAPRRRSPETDPMMFEGIPPFGDGVAMRKGDWLVVLGSFAPTGRAGAKPGPAGPTATIVRASDPRVAARQQQLWNANRVPWAVWSDAIPRFEKGLVVVVEGPYPKDEAERQLAALRDVVPDAYLKRGW